MNQNLLNNCHVAYIESNIITIKNLEVKKRETLIVGFFSSTFKSF